MYAANDNEMRRKRPQDNLARRYNILFCFQKQRRRRITLGTNAHFHFGGGGRPTRGSAQILIKISAHFFVIFNSQQLYRDCRAANEAVIQETPGKPVALDRSDTRERWL